MQGKMKINFNTADVYELASINGIGFSTAQEIVNYRDAHGPFENCEELGRFVTPGDPNTRTTLREVCTLS